MDEALARQFWREQKGFLFDPVAYLVKAPNLRATWDWPEYPSGEFVVVTNERGFREDQPTPQEFPGPRILVSGDSHTDGTVENRSSFANLAEERLREELHQEVDVINAGVGSTSPSCYLGMLKKCLELRPDVFVAVLHAGNDFQDEIGLAHLLGRRQAPSNPPEYLARAKAVAEGFLGFYQCLNQAYRFRTFPGEAEAATALVIEQVLAIEELCRQQNITFLLVLLPTKLDVEDDDRETWLKAYRELGLDERDAPLGLELGRRVLAAAREHGIECLDPTDAMRAASAPLYWRKDYHLGLEGHALLGTLLAERLEAILARRAAGGGARRAAGALLQR